MGLVALLATSARAGITGSAHDFSTKAWSGNQICLPCHIPHNAAVKDADGADINGPLWNHTLSTATYTLYTAAEAPKDGGGNPVVTGKVDQNSILCLSCHDGTVALDSFGGGAGTAGVIAGTEGAYGSANLGSDLSNDHPIGARALITDPVYMVPQATRDAASIMPARLMADGSKAVGCTSCHEPHNRKSQPHMLWAPISGAYTTVDGRSVGGSGLCMNCHKK
jgi:hypothetical protein